MHQQLGFDEQTFFEELAQLKNIKNIFKVAYGKNFSVLANSGTGELLAFGKNWAPFKFSIDLHLPKFIVQMSFVDQHTQLRVTNR